MSRSRQPVLLFACAVSLLVLILFFYWFALADRYVVFLYNHDMGLDTSPFSRVTRSRYWMAGLVASGAVMLFYTAVNWLLGRPSKGYTPPNWQPIWGWSALPLLIGIPLITMMANQPTLPFVDALKVTLAVMMGMAMALLPGKLAAEQPAQLIWLTLDGLGIMLILTGVTHLQELGRWVTIGRIVYVWMAFISFAAGLGWLLILSDLRFWRKTAVHAWKTLCLAGVCFSYLLMPLIHHTLFTDGYFYISDSDNFFAQTIPFQIVAWVITAVLIGGITRLRGILAVRQAA